MNITLSTIANVAVLILVSAPVFASENCRDVLADEARLACYDSINLAQPARSPIQQRKAQEAESLSNRFALTPHRPNYILPVSYNASANFEKYGPFRDLLSKTEIKFQLSLKVMLLNDLWQNSYIHAAYTQLSFWQLYAKERASAPFRETNHEPEFIWTIPLKHEVFGFSARQVSFKLNHQSNGKSEPLSRSWNRIIGEYVAERDRVALSVSGWWRVEESSQDDDNPDIEDYMGRLSVGAAYIGDTHTFALGIRNNAETDNRSGAQFDWQFPLSGKLNGYVQVYTGYGESLIDQKDYANRISLGISLTDWL